MTPAASGRGIGAFEALSGPLPDWIVAVLVLVTQLGDVWFVVGLVTLVYWFVDRRAGAFAIVTLLGGLGLVVGLKAAFALPRPPASAWRIAVDGYGFPSGHALTTTVAWGALALALDAVWTRPRRGLVAGAVVVAVATSRVALGLHYAVDVVAGAMVGLAYLALIAWWGPGDPARAGGTAVAVAVAGVVLSGFESDAVTLLGGAAGAALAWRVVDVPARPWRRDGLVPAAAGGAVVGGTLTVGYGGPLPLPLGVVMGAGTGAFVIALPVLVDLATALRA